MSLPLCFDRKLSELNERVSLGLERSCSEQLQGQMWFNPLRRGLYLCDGAEWVTVLEGESPRSKTSAHKQVFLFHCEIDKSFYLLIYSDHKRLDYVLEHQVLTTSSETHDVEVSFFFFLYLCTIFTCIVSILAVPARLQLCKTEFIQRGIFLFFSCEAQDTLNLIYSILVGVG